jgi:hypothetical protein
MHQKTLKVNAKPTKFDNGPEFEKALKKADKMLKLNSIPVYIRPGLTVFVDNESKIPKMIAKYADK